MTINIALTSYPRRITNCVRIINSVLDNTVPPDRIYLTLSHLEFPNYERDLPTDLYRLIMTSNKVILNWVEDNYKSMKKVFPILPYLEDDDIIIPIDDDMLLPKDLIESRLKDFNDYGCKFPITSNLCKTINMDNYVFTVYSLVQKKMLNGYDKFVNEIVLNTFNDDRTCLYLCHMNGYQLKPCTKYCYNPNNKHGVVTLKIAPRSDYQYQVGGLYDKIVQPVIRKLSNGRDIRECFNLFNENDEQPQTKKDLRIQKESEELAIWKPSNEMKTSKLPISKSISKMFQYNLKKPMKHDLVYVLGKGSKYNNLEIKISITSMLKFCDHWVRDIYVVGENPHIVNPRVKYVYVPDLTKNNKDANIIHKIYMSIQKIPQLSENFLFCSDDILVTKKSDWEDFAPRYIFEYNQDKNYRDKLFEKTKHNAWDMLALKTMDRFIGYRKHIYLYEPHIFAPINKGYFKQMCKQIDYANEKNVIIMSLWFNWLNLSEPQEKHDHVSFFNSGSIPNSLPTERHLTYNDKSFSNKTFRENLIRLVTMDEFK